MFSFLMLIYNELKNKKFKMLLIRYINIQKLIPES